ncbi:recombinase [Vibrio phage 1.198.B._10N.286.54.F4]|nr:recombinase [Vibrio phage 1.198.A._10N.286.54.F4]AUR94861.1 recombinase [Vibrio phage 1.198.B._10N.286.54.F4]
MAFEKMVTNTNGLHEISGYTHDHFENGGGPLKFRITNCGNRSLSQNNLYWKWLTEVAQQTKQKGYGDYDSEDMHEYYKDRFCPDKSLTIGKTTIQVKSTKKLDKGEMTLYMNQIHQWSVNAGFRLSMPEDSEYMKAMQSQNM